MFRVSGRGAVTAFAHEAGGHRFQRVPPNEKRGRVHTSTITVAVLDEADAPEIDLDLREVRQQFTRGSGKGGQHRNKTDTCVQLWHEPSGMRVRCDGGRSQPTNRDTALQLLRDRLAEHAGAQAKTARNRQRRAQLGGGARGDKRRTIAIQRDRVTDHELGSSMSARRYMRGHLWELTGRAKPDTPGP